jgi:deoxyribodipyrimidine photo-lyase
VIFSRGVVHSQKEWTPEELNVAVSVKDNTSNLNLNWVESYDQFLFHPDDIPFKWQGIPKVFTQFRKLCEKSVTVRPLPLLGSLLPANFISDTASDIISNTDSDTRANYTPTLQDLGFEDFTLDSRSAFPFKGKSSRDLLVFKIIFGTLKISHATKQQEMGLSV